MESLKKGKRLVVSIIIFVLVLDIIVIAISSSFYAVSGMLGQATYKIAQGLFRLFLEGIILFFLYAGHRWAKWLLSILFFLGGLFSLFSALATFSFLLLFMGVAYITIGIILLSSKPVKDFLEYQKKGKINDLDNNLNDF